MLSPDNCLSVSKIKNFKKRRDKNMTKEQKFYNALKDLFVGAKIEGESGYINLMRIKSRYYEEKVFPKLHADIESALEQFPEFKEELFDKLYTFFSRYFSESGSIYFTQTRYHQSVYEKICEVILGEVISRRSP